MGSGIHDAFSRARPALLKEGYAVVDGAIDANSLNNLHQSMCCLTEASGLRPHRFGFRRDAQSKAEIYFKPHILEAEVEDESVQNVATHLKETLEQLDIAGHAASAFPDFKLKKEHGTVKLQCNEGGGGCFPMHYDNAGPPNRRKLTCLVYLNPEWKEKDGGQLVLYPWLSSESCVAPLHGRIVLFRSDTVCHRVLPCHARRFCITVWLEADDLHHHTKGPADRASAPGRLSRTEERSRTASALASSLRRGVRTLTHAKHARRAAATWAYAGRP